MPESKQTGHAVQKETSRSSCGAWRSTGSRRRDLLVSYGAIRGGDRQTRLLLCHLIISNIEERRVTQAVAADLLGVNQPKISALAHYKVEGFSVERLMTFLNALGQDVEIVIRTKPSARSAAHTTVQMTSTDRATPRSIHLVQGGTPAR